MIEVVRVCATNTTINLFNNRNYTIWEDTACQSGYVFSQHGEWQFYVIDEAHNRHISDWNRQPSEGIYELSEDTIWLFQRIDNRWEKIRGLLTLQATDFELTVKLLDNFDGWTLSSFDVHLRYLNDDTITILNSEQWDQTWNPIYQKRPMLMEYSFPVCTLKNKKVKKLLRDFVKDVRNTISDTTNISIELYIEKRKTNVCLIANSLYIFSWKDVWGVLDGMEIPIFILYSETNSSVFTKKSATITHSICMEETKYKNGIISHDICDDYLSELPIKSICIPLWRRK